jgi:hypothetical protein
LSPVRKAGGDLDAADARTLASLLTELRLVVEGGEFRAVVGVTTSSPCHDWITA